VSAPSPRRGLSSRLSTYIFIHCTRVWTSSAYHSKHCTARYQDTREGQVDQERTERGKDLQKMGFTWEEAEVAALDRHGCHRSVAQCVQFKASSGLVLYGLASSQTMELLLLTLMLLLCCRGVHVYLLSLVSQPARVCWLITTLSSILWSHGVYISTHSSCSSCPMMLHATQPG